MINEEMLGKFKKLHFENYGIKLSDEEATKMATDFLNLMKILVKPLPHEYKK